MSNSPFRSATESFRVDGMHGEIVADYRPPDLERSLQPIIDPDASCETIHWGRNYIYKTTLQTADGDLPVAVKQFRNKGIRSQLRRRSGRSKAALSWRAARAFGAAGLATAEAILVIESDETDGPSFFVTRYLEDMVEARYLLRAANTDRVDDEFPGLDLGSFFQALGDYIRELHGRGFFHRDLSIGNILFPYSKASNSDEQEITRLSASDLILIDLNRSRQSGRVSLWNRTRDLCRMTIERPEHRQALLTAYWGGEDQLSWFRRALYSLLFHGFHGRIGFKKAIRKRFAGLKDWIRPRRAHVHIPEAPASASNRDKIVWDHLSDQPHQHATRLEKFIVRTKDLPSHVGQGAAFLINAPRIWTCYRRLRSRVGKAPVDWPGLGICVRPDDQSQELIAALIELNVQQVQIRIHCWDDQRQQDAAFATELRNHGFDLSFVLAQDRSLVTDRRRWRRAIHECAELLTPLGKHFQIGQAINRSKWGIWRYDEYLELAAEAAEILRSSAEVEILGPAVIDFEPHVTAAVVNLPKARFGFDILATLLYVDRRGAPENPQLGFDTVDKTVLMQAIAETSRWCSGRTWITEVNWPLWEGPHSPAGRSVAVDEETQAMYLVRYFLLTLTTGLVERAYWWQLVAKGYGLIDPAGLRRRPSFVAMAVLEDKLRGATFLGNLSDRADQYLLRFTTRSGHEMIVGWSTRVVIHIDLDEKPIETTAIDGTDLGDRHPAKIGPAPTYFDLGPAQPPARR